MNNSFRTDFEIDEIPAHDQSTLGRVFRDLQSSVGHSAPADLFRGVWQALYASAGGIAIAIVCYAAYNYLVGRVSAIVLDMRKSSGEVIRLVGHETISGGAKE